MYALQPILNIAQICAKKGLRNAVLSPGSRVAPLVFAFVRHPDIQTFSVPDERVAGFIALGMAQQTKQPTVLACTSGTAGVNYGPAIAEAFYQEIPLLVFTADRPPEWIDQQDGQAIRQTNLHQNHCKANYQLPVDYSHLDAIWHIERIISEAINLANTHPAGPVHINAPFREPFYPETGEGKSFSDSIKLIDEWQTDAKLSDNQWQNIIAQMQGKKIMIVGGQEAYSPNLVQTLSRLGMLTIADVVSNLHEVSGSIKRQDAWLKKDLPEQLAKELQPDLLITFGKSIVSKNLKLFLRKYKPKQHWHLKSAGQVADTFQSLTDILRIQPLGFFQELYSRLGSIQFGEENSQAELVQAKTLKSVGKTVNTSIFNHKKSYQEKWQKLDNQCAIIQKGFFEKQIFGEFTAVSALIEALPTGCNFHLANSMSVRYANFIGLPEKGGREIFANRGTSGIDGSNSTMVGNAMLSDKIQVLLTGDLSFFYDRNAFWHQYLTNNLRIVLLNNNGGVIFRMIDGPARQPELEEYFEAHQSLSAESLAKELGFSYHQASSQSEYEAVLTHFFDDAQQPKILEIKTEKAQSEEVLKGFRNEMKKVFF